MDIFTLNPLAAYLWEELATPHGLEELTERVTADFEVDASRARRDVDDFLQRLLNTQLIERVAS